MDKESDLFWDTGFVSPSTTTFGSNSNNDSLVQQQSFVAGETTATTTSTKRKKKKKSKKTTVSTTTTTTIAPAAANSTCLLHTPPATMLQPQQQQLHEIPHKGSLYRRSNVMHSTISYEYVIEIGFVPQSPVGNAPLPNLSPTTTATTMQLHRHQLVFPSQDYEFMSRLFSILDTDSRGIVSREALQRFVTLRCPVFWRRDEDLRRLSSNHHNETITMSPTFDEIWQAVVDCDPKITNHTTKNNNKNNDDDQDNLLLLFNTPVPNNNSSSVGLGVEGWMVFCRFVALAQYLEAKRRFSARHLQQTMRHRNSPRGSELVVVNVPPPDSPKPLTPLRLVQYYQQPSSPPLPLPELDLDHSLVAAHDVCQQHKKQYQQQRRQRRHNEEDVDGRRPYHCQKPRKTPVGVVKIALFGSGGGGGSVVASKQHQPQMHPQHAHYPYHHTPQSSLTSSSSSAALMDFALTYQSYDNHMTMMMDSVDGNNGTEIVVRRSFADTKWLHETFQSHKGLGGTLCGRILPPFPADTTTTATLKTKFQPHERTLQDGTGAAVKVAAAGVGMITNAAKSFWGNYLTSKSSSSTTLGTKPENHDTTNHNNHNGGGNNGSSSNHAATTSAKKAETINKRSIHRTVSENYYNPNSATFKGRQIERYLNYLLEHPALSTSFPLNTILTASQSGLEAARLILADHAKAMKQVKEQTQKMSSTGGKSRLSLWANQALPANYTTGMPWVKTAAQAAVALHVHGLLETTGLPSASARLQHASLPTFVRKTGWVDEECGRNSQGSSHSSQGVEGAESFEHGVIQVESELLPNTAADSEGYDLLPLPVPAPERRILCAGSSNQNSRDNQSVEGNSRFRYGAALGSGDRLHSMESSSFQVESAFLGEFSVDENIDKLREVIGSVDSTLSRCLCAIAAIGETRRDLASCHTEVVRGFDSWEGLRGKFVSQRALLRGVAGLEQGKEIAEESDLEMTDDMSWQASLASSAVSAAEDVRSTVRAARVAANAKAAADSAALAAQSACDGTTFASIDEARAAQTRSSIAQSHAIHAAVVEHEASAAKRSAAMALAHDVKCWNIHRKRELWKSCLAFARSQHVATRRSVDAWSCLRDGYLGSTVVPYAEERAPPPPPLKETVFAPPPELNPVVDRVDKVRESEHEVSAKIYSEVSPDMESAMGAPTIEVVDHVVLAAPEVETPKSVVSKPLTAIEEEEEATTTEPPIVEASVIPSDDMGLISPGENNNKNNNNKNGSKDNGVFGPSDNENLLSASMQSLVDGLMNWDSQYESQEDLTLPSGLTASIVLEGSSAVN